MNRPSVQFHRFFTGQRDNDNVKEESDIFCVCDATRKEFLKTECIQCVFPWAVYSRGSRDSSNLKHVRLFPKISSILFQYLLFFSISELFSRFLSRSKRDALASGLRNTFEILWRSDRPSQKKKKNGLWLLYKELVHFPGLHWIDHWTCTWILLKCFFNFSIKLSLIIFNKNLNYYK